MIVQGANGELEGAKGLLFAVVTKVETVHVDDLILLMNNLYRERKKQLRRTTLEMLMLRR